MTTLYEVKVHCPCCETDFDSITFGSTNTFGGCTTDFNKRAEGDQVIPYLIHTCSACGFTGEYENFTRKLKSMDKIREKVREEITPLLKKGKISNGRRYEWAAWIARWKNEPFPNIANLYLRAAWCCAEERRDKILKPRNKEEEKHYRLKAIEYWEKFMERQTARGKQGDLAMIAYLVGECYRRIGDREKAGIWFDRVPALVGDDPEGQELVALAEQQKSNPQDFLPSDGGEIILTG